ncbi:Repetin [Streptomyces sp. NPDC093094]|uniref:Repetin n=1 Tax=Streptomyces sp. NPDC093094 TaxID=3366026 RepID=UPI0038024457
MNRRTKTAVLGAALLLTAAGAAAAASGTEGSSKVSASGTGRSPEAAASAGQRAREAAALTGSAKLYRSGGDDITFTFDAHLAAKHRTDPTKATGTFEFSHYVGGEGGWAKVRVDCLVTGGEVAVVSGVVTGSDLPGVKGKRLGVTVHDRGRDDRLGYSWATTEGMGPKNLPKCVSSAPFEKVEKGTGDFTVLPWNPPL